MAKCIVQAFANKEAKAAAEASGREPVPNRGQILLDLSDLAALVRGDENALGLVREAYRVKFGSLPTGRPAKPRAAKPAESKPAAKPTAKPATRKPRAGASK